jgi:hypothetical protein
VESLSEPVLPPQKTYNCTGNLRLRSLNWFSGGEDIDNQAFRSQRASEIAGYSPVVTGKVCEGSEDGDAERPSHEALCGGDDESAAPMLLAGQDKGLGASKLPAARDDQAVV